MSSCGSRLLQEEIELLRRLSCLFLSASLFLMPCSRAAGRSPEKSPEQTLSDLEQHAASVLNRGKAEDVSDALYDLGQAYFMRRQFKKSED